MQSTASGKDSVLFSGDFSRAVVFVCRKKLLRQTSALYIPYLYGEPSPPGASQNRRTWYTAIYYRGEVASAGEDSRTNNSRRTAVCRKAGSVFSFPEAAGKEDRIMEAIKEAMTQYWGCRAEKFSDLRRREFAGEKHRQWAAELDRYIPSGRKLRILDIGTGTGFFAFLLAERGHAVTAIDLTPEMIAEAERMGKKLGLSVDFRVMDAEHPNFPPHSFDAIVTRKLTWTLPDLPGAYRTWRSLLKPGGILVNFDADYCREKPAVLPPHHAHQDVGAELLREYERMKSVLRPCQQPRPLWDTELLRQAGFSDIAVDTGVWQRIYGEADEFYDPTPGFALQARG